MLDPHEALHSELGDRFELQDLLADGGMGTVYVAHDRKHDRPVAIKTIRPDLGTGTIPERFEREIRITARLQHAHILPLLDSGVAGDVVYYIMPLVEGESLKERIAREGQLDLELAIRLTEQVCAALDYAHRMGIVHRDIKPANILVSYGQAIVTDFGVAHAIGEAGGDRLTRTGLTVGSPIYMSPEQAAGSGEIDGRSDIYSLGCVAYEMLVGEPPFKGASPQIVLMLHMSEPVPRLAPLRHDVPPHLEAAIRKALAKEPAARFPGPCDFAEALRDRSPAEWASGPS